MSKQLNGDSFCDICNAKSKYVVCYPEGYNVFCSKKHATDHIIKNISKLIQNKD